MNDSKLEVVRNEDGTLDFSITGAWNILELYGVVLKGLQQFVRDKFSDKLSDAEQRELADMAYEAVWLEDEFDDDEDDEGEVLD